MRISLHTHLPLFFSFTSISVVFASNSITPSNSDWKALNASLLNTSTTARTGGAVGGGGGGGLYPGIPIARSCFSNATRGTQGIFDPGVCEGVVLPNYRNNTFREATPGGYQLIQWESCQATGSNCFLSNVSEASGSLPASNQVCDQANVPSYFVEVLTPADAIVGFKFAEKFGLNLVVKGNGHDVYGRSAGKTPLALWTRNIKDLALAPSFVPQGCQNNPIVVPQSAAVVGAGITVRELYVFAENNNVTVPGGGYGSVGVGGGYTQGGGHGPLSNALGLAIDRALQYEVVTPTGEHLFANQCQNQDLFFAINGGGGGTFGVVLRHWTKVFPKLSIQVAQLTFDDTEENRRIALEVNAENAVKWALEGWGTIYYLVPPTPVMILLNTYLNDSAAAASLAPVRNLTSRLTGANYTTSVEPSYYSFWIKYVDPVDMPVSNPTNLASRLIPSSLFSTPTSRSNLTNSILQTISGHQFNFVFGVAPLYFGIHNPQNINSATPAWRNAIWQVGIEDTWDPFASRATVEGIYERTTKSMDILRRLTPGGGTYFNEGDLREPNFQNTFWGAENYARLLKIKQKYDPNHILDCWHCVGFTRSLPKYACYI